MLTSRKLYNDLCSYCNESKQHQKQYSVNMSVNVNSCCRDSPAVELTLVVLTSSS